jgi:hypothetical protein
MESIAGVSGRSALDHFEFTDVRFGMRVPDTATVFQFWSYQRCICFLFHFLCIDTKLAYIFIYWICCHGFLCVFCTNFHNMTYN